MADGTGRPVLVLGLGNPLRGDDGIGPAVIAALRQVELPSKVELLDGGTAGLSLLSAIAGRQRLLVVDAADMGRPAGTVLCLRPGEVSLERVEAPISPHQLGLVETLDLAGQLGLAPHMVQIFAVQPGQIGWGQELSPEVQACLPQIVADVLVEIDGPKKARATACSGGY